MNTTLCEQCFPGWGEHEVLTIVPLGPCCQCGKRDERHKGGTRCHLFRSDPRPTRTEPMTEGELWSWVRSVMSQGADIRCDYEQGKHTGYEAYSARLDAAAAERADELWARLKTPNVGAKA